MQTMMNLRQMHGSANRVDNYESENEHNYENKRVERRSDRKTTPINVSYTGIVLDPNMLEQ